MLNTDITTDAASATLTEQIDRIIQSCADCGVELAAGSAEELLSGVDDPDATAQTVHELARLIGARFGVVSYIHYVEDLAFHDAVSKTTSAFLSTMGEDIPTQDADRMATESLLAAGIWPNSWETLMDEEKRIALINKIIAERKPPCPAQRSVTPRD